MDENKLLERITVNPKIFAANYREYADDGYLEYGRVHAQLSRACEDVHGRYQVGFVLHGCVRDDSLHDNAGVRAQWLHAGAYVRAFR